MSMTCEQFQEHLGDVLDARRAPDDAARQHAAECPACGSQWDDYSLLEAAIRDWRSRPGPTVDLTDRIVAALQIPDGTARATGPVRNQTLRRRAGFWSALVTVSLVLIAVVMVMRDTPRNVARVPDEKPAPQAVPESPLAPREQQVADIRVLLSDAGSAWYGLARQAAVQAEDLSVFVPDLTGDFGLSGSEAATSPVKKPVPEKDEEPAPAPGRLKRAIDFLFETAGAQDA